MRKKRIFAKKARPFGAKRSLFGKKGEPSLVKIIAGIVVVAVLVLGVPRVYQHFSAKRRAEKQQVAAPANLDQAQTQFEAGNAEQARATLENLIAHVNDPSVTPDALQLLARIEQEAGRHEQAAELLRRAKEGFPHNPRSAEVAIAYARALEHAGRTRDAAVVYEEVRSEAPPEWRAAALNGLGRKAEAEGDLVLARTFYAQSCRDAAWDSASWNEALDALGRVNAALIFSPEPTPESKVYSVRSGDTLTSIGINLNTTQGLLTRANGIEDPSKLQLDQRLKYTPKDFRIVIERATCRLFLLDKDGLFKRYYVGLGKKGHETTLGAYMVGNKEKDPTWHPPGREPIPPGDPENELGTRWMPLVPLEDGLPMDLGIHGTLKPETVGTYASMGCARMLKDDVEELYDLVVRSTPVEIVEEFRLEPPEAA